MSWADDLMMTWKSLLVTILVTVTLTLLYIRLMSAYAYEIAMFSLISVEIMFIFIIAALIYVGAMQVGLCLLLGFLLWNCCLYCRWSHFKTAIAIINAAADYLADTKRVLLVVLLYYVL